MIVRRKRGQALRRAIIRRTGAVTVGEHRPPQPARPPGGVIGAEEEQRPREWRFPVSMRIIVALCALAVVLGLAAGGWWVVRSPYFEIDTIEVTGTDRLAAEAVVARSGLLGTSMFRADLAAAQADVVTLALVKDVRIERDWPRTVRIVVEERQPWGTWEQAGVRYAIDREGVVLGTFAVPESAALIHSAETGTRQPGDRVSYQAVDAAAEIAERLPGELGTTVTEVAFLAGMGVRVTVATGQVALFGDSSAIAYKLAVWAAIQEKADERGLSYDTVDLRFGNRPVVQ